MSSLHNIIKGLTSLSVASGKWSGLLERLNLIQDGIKRIAIGENIVAGEGIRVKRLSGSSIMLSASRINNNNNTLENHPWMPYGAGGGAFRITPGTLDGRLAENWNDEFEVSGDKESHWCYLSAQLDSKVNLISYKYEFGSEPEVTTIPLDGEPPSVVYYPLFSFDTIEGSIARAYLSNKKNLELTVRSNPDPCGETYSIVNIQALN